MTTLLRTFLLAAILLLFGQAAAQQATPPPYCESGNGFTDFDFWVGEWDVYSNDDDRQLLGTNRITKHHGDCLLKEDWQGAGGSSGFSINYFNSVTGAWRQVWVSNGYSIDYTGGLNDSGAMVLEGTIFNYASEAKQKFRGTWTPRDDGTVVQRFDIYNAENDAWSVWFEGLYIKRDG